MRRTVASKRLAISASESSEVIFMAKDIDTYFAEFPNLDEDRVIFDDLKNERSKTGFIKTLPQDAKQYAQIGKIAASWAYIEYLIDLSIWVLCGDEFPVYACLTAQMIGPMPRLQALISLCGYTKLIASVDMLNKFKSHVGHVAELRNRYVHDVWGLQQTEKTIDVVKKTLTAKGLLKMELEKIEDKDFERVLFKIEKMRDIFELRIAPNILSEAGL